jgi:hypothetical protein
LTRKASFVAISLFALLRRKSTFRRGLLIGWLAGWLVVSEFVEEAHSHDYYYNTKKSVILPLFPHCRILSVDFFIQIGNETAGNNSLVVGSIRPSFRRLSPLLSHSHLKLRKRSKEVDLEAKSWPNAT